MKIILFLLFPVFLFGQLLTETFNDFRFDSTDSDLRALYRGKVMTTDRSGNSKTLTAGNSAGDSLLGGQPWFLGDSAVFLDSTTSQYLYRDNADMNLVNNFTVILKGKWTNHGGAVEHILNANYNRIYIRSVLSGQKLECQYYTSGNILLSESSYYPDFFDGNWHVVVYTKGDGSGTSEYAYRLYDNDSLLQEKDSTEAVGVYAPDPRFVINGEPIAGPSVRNFAEGQYYEVTILDRWITDKEVNEITYLADGWASNSGGAYRNNWAFSQGVITDTVYYNTALTAGNWQVQVDVDGNSGGETYRILTSADKSTWSNIGSGTAPASSTTKIFTGRGLGYIGLAVSSATDTVFFDNLTVSVPSANAEFKQNSGWNKFKGW